MCSRDGLGRTRRCRHAQAGTTQWGAPAPAASASSFQGRVIATEHARACEGSGHGGARKGAGSRAAFAPETHARTRARSYAACVPMCPCCPRSLKTSWNWGWMPSPALPCTLPSSTSCVASPPLTSLSDRVAVVHPLSCAPVRVLYVCARRGANGLLSRPNVTGERAHPV